MSDGRRWSGLDRSHHHRRDCRLASILLLRAALACHAGMATFAEAGVSGAGK